MPCSIGESPKAWLMSGLFVGFLQAARAAPSRSGAMMGWAWQSTETRWIAHENFIPAASHLRSRASCADGARSGYECCFQDFYIQSSTEKPSAGMFFVLSSLAFRGRDAQPRAWRHVQTLRENVLQPQGQLVRYKNPEPWQYHAPLQGGASRSSLKSCAKPGDGFLS